MTNILTSREITCVCRDRNVLAVTTKLNERSSPNEIDEINGDGNTGRRF